MFTLILTSKSADPNVSPDWLAKVAMAVSAQLVEFCEDYGLALWTVTTDTTVPGFAITVFDVSDEKGAEGYHDDKGNVPAGKVFHLGALDDLSVTISHECLELIRDQDCAGYRLGLDGIAYADEACDAVEDQTYAIDGVLVSDYVLPAWYVDGSAGPWDKLSRLSGPFTKTSGGYFIELKGGTVDTNPPEAKLRTKKAMKGSRTMRRLRAARALAA